MGRGRRVSGSPVGHARASVAIAGSAFPVSVASLGLLVSAITGCHGQMGRADDGLHGVRRFFQGGKTGCAYVVDVRRARFLDVEKGNTDSLRRREDLIVDALRHWSLPSGTPGDVPSSVDLYWVILENDEGSLIVHLAAEGFSIGRTRQYHFTNAELAGLLRSVVLANGKLSPSEREGLERALKAASGEVAEPSRTDR